MSNYLITAYVLEDDEIFGKLVKKALEDDQRFDVTVFDTGESLLEHLDDEPDIITIDYYLPEISGLDVLKKVKAHKPDTIAIMVSGQEDVEVAVQAFRAGARDYVVKTGNPVEELVSSVKNFTSAISLRKEVEDLRSRILDREKYEEIIGESKPILKVLRLLQKVEKTDIMVLLTGESGTGKEIVAHNIHYNSPRKKKPFVTVNMPAIPEDLVESELFGHEKGAFTGANSRRIGKFEEADQGTIFLDEIGELSFELQAKLLRVLQEKKVTRVGSNKEIKLDVRVIAATNRNLHEMVKHNQFREDLFYRLQGFLIHLPPLRERGNDVILLSRHFLGEFAQTYGTAKKSLSREAYQALLEYHWPGNIRELRTVIERALLISETETITADDLIFPTVTG